MIELYEFPPTRSQRAKWALEELELDFRSHRVGLNQGEQNSDAYRAIHPLGVVPTLKTSDYTIFESVAIVLQLIDEHPEKGLAPALGSPQRALYYQWSIFACAELDPAIILVFDHTMRPGADYNSALAAQGRKNFSIRAEALSTRLRDRDYLLGAEFSGADIQIGHSCFMAGVTDLIDDYPILRDYYDRLQKRPAHRRAYGKTPLAAAPDLISGKT